MSAVPSSIVLNHAQRVSLQEGIFRPVVPQVVRRKAFDTGKFAQLTHALVNALARDAPALVAEEEGSCWIDKRQVFFCCPQGGRHEAEHILAVRFWAFDADSSSPHIGTSGIS